MMLKILTFRLYSQNHDHKNKIFLMQIFLIYTLKLGQLKSPLIPHHIALVLANVILTEFEKVVVTPFMESGILNFYYGYVDDTSVLVKEIRLKKF